MNTDALEIAADILAQARLNREPFGGFPDTCRPASEAVAYQVQDRLRNKLETRGQGGLVAHKVGCTTGVMQRYLGIHNPCAGSIVSHTLHHQQADCRHADFCRVGVECEIAVRLGKTLPKRQSAYDLKAVTAAVDACMAAIEIVDDRYVDYKSLDTLTLIADDFFNAGAVLGPAVENWSGLDLASLEGRMSINGEHVGQGCGADILGHPLNALAWLANSLNDRERALQAGDIVLLGSVVQTRWLEAGDTVEIDIEGLGKARATFT